TRPSPWPRHPAYDMALSTRHVRPGEPTSRDGTPPRDPLATGGSPDALEESVERAIRLRCPVVGGAVGVVLLVGLVSVLQGAGGLGLSGVVRAMLCALARLGVVHTRAAQQEAVT